MVCFVKLGTTFSQLHFGVLALNRVVFGEIVDSFDEFGTVGKVSSSSTIMGPGLLSSTNPGSRMHELLAWECHLSILGLHTTPSHTQPTHMECMHVRGCRVEP